MSNDVVVAEVVEEDNPQPNPQLRAEYILTMSEEDFSNVEHDEKLVLLFALVRDMAGEVRALTDYVHRLESDAREAIEGTMKKFGGGMLGGMFG